MENESKEEQLDYSQHQGPMEIGIFLNTFRDGRVIVSSQTSYNMYYLLLELQRLRNRQFIDPLFADGTEKLFFDVGWAVSDNLYKSTPLGIKDIQPFSTSRLGAKALPLIKFALRSYLKDTMFTEIADEARKEVIDLGHVVIKIVNGIPRIVQLTNIITQPNIKTLQDGSFVEQIDLTYEQLMEYKDSFTEHWKEIMNVYSYNAANGRPFVTIYEYWTRDKFDGDEISKGCKTYLDRTYHDETKINDPKTWSPYLEIARYKTTSEIKIKSKKRKKELGKDTELVYPYEEVKLFSIAGRWQGLGIYELIKGILEYLNENMNLKRKFDQLQYRGITIHHQPSSADARTITQEFLQNLPSGAVIDTVGDETLTRLNLGTVTADAIATNNSLLDLIKMIVGIAVQVQFDQMKPGITAEAINANQKLAETTYGTVVRQMSFLLRRLFNNFLLKDIIEEMTMEDWLSITGDPKELQTMEEILVEPYVNQKMIEKIEFLYSDSVKNGHIPTDQELSLLQEGIDMDKIELTAEIKKELQSTGSQRWVELTKELIKEAEIGVDFSIDGEQFDVQKQIEVIDSLLQDPNLTLNREELETEKLRLLNMDEKRFQKTEQQKQQEAQMAMAQQGMPQPGQPQQAGQPQGQPVPQMPQPQKA